MYNCWNKALEYVNKHPLLLDKKGEIKTHPRNDIVHKIQRLMGQYYLGIEAKKDLWWVLVYDCGVISEDIDPMQN